MPPLYLELFHSRLKAFCLQPRNYQLMKHLKVGFETHKLDSLLLSSKYMANYMYTKTCSFLHPHFTVTMKVVASLF